MEAGDRVNATGGLPESLTEIGSRVFSLCYKICKIKIPDWVSHIGNGAFTLCDELADVSLRLGLTQVGDEIFQLMQSFDNHQNNG